MGARAPATTCAQASGPGRAPWAPGQRPAPGARCAGRRGAPATPTTCYICACTWARAPAADVNDTGRSWRAWPIPWCRPAGRTLALLRAAQRRPAGRARRQRCVWARQLCVGRAAGGLARAPPANWRAASRPAGARQPARQLDELAADGGPARNNRGVCVRARRRPATYARAKSAAAGARPHARPLQARPST